MRAFLLLALIGLALGVSVGVVMAQSVSTPTPTPTSSWPSLIDTPTPYDDYRGSYACPTGTPVGWGTVTPSVDWVLSCWSCLSTPTPTFTVTPTVTVGPGTPTSTSVPATPTVTVVSFTPTPSLGSLQFYEFGDTPDCSRAVYYWERTVAQSGPGAKWPTVEGRLYGCGPYPRQGTLHYQLDIQYNNPYSGSVCLGFGVNDGGGVNLGCISSGAYHYEGDLSVSPGGYFWPGKLMSVYNYNSTVNCSSCNGLSYTARLVVWVVGRYGPTPTPTPTPVPSYCSRVDPGQDLSSYFDFAGLSVIKETCYNIPSDLPGSLDLPSFRLCIDEVVIGDLRVMGYVIHTHYIILGLVAILLYRYFIKV